MSGSGQNEPCRPRSGAAGPPSIADAAGASTAGQAASHVDLLGYRQSVRRPRCRGTARYFLFFGAQAIAGRLSIPGAAVSSTPTLGSPTNKPSTLSSRRCAGSSGYSTARSRSRGPSRCCAICRATPIALLSRTVGLSLLMMVACVPLEGLSHRRSWPLENDVARTARVYPPVPDARVTEGLPSHPPLRAVRKRRELPRPPGCYARVLKRVGIQYWRIVSTAAGISLWAVRRDCSVSVPCLGGPSIGRP